MNLVPLRFCSGSLLVAAPLASAACSGACTDSRQIAKAAFDMSTGESIKFLLGPANVETQLDTIEAGGMLGEVWTYVQVPSTALSPQTIAGTIQLDIDGIAVSHEFFGDDLSSSTAKLKDLRLDFISAPTTTTGSLRFDRSVGGSVDIDVTYKGTSTLYGAPTYIEFQITTGFPVEPK